jgi:predicted RNase H-like nuclease (RuvC/YqgF family)
MKDTVTRVCGETLGKPKRINEDWFDENDKAIEKLTAEKREAFREKQANKKCKRKREKYHELRAKVQRHTRKMKDDWWKDKAAEIQDFSDRNMTREFYAATSKLYGPKSKGSMPVANRDGNCRKTKARSGSDGKNISLTCSTKTYRWTKRHLETFLSHQ